MSESDKLFDGTVSFFSVQFIGQEKIILHVLLPASLWREFGSWRFLFNYWRISIWYLDSYECCATVARIHISLGPQLILFRLNTVARYCVKRL